MSHAKLISESLLNRFKEAVSKHKPPKMSDFCESFLLVVEPYVSEHLASQVVAVSRGGAGVGVGATKGKAKGNTKDKGSDSSDKKYNNWARCWASTEYGGKGYFKDDYEEIKATQKQLKAEKSDDAVGDSHFTILKLLRDRLEAEEDQARWVEWYEWVQANNSEAPSDPPTERKPKQEGKKAATTKAETSKKTPAAAAGAAALKSKAAAAAAKQTTASNSKPMAKLTGKSVKKGETKDEVETEAEVEAEDEVEADAEVEDEVEVDADAVDEI